MTLRNLSTGKITSLIALCPLLLASHSMATGLGLGLTSLFATFSAAVVIYLGRGRINELTKITLTALTITTFAICAIFIIQAFAYELWQSLGIYIFIAASIGLILISPQQSHSLTEGVQLGLVFLGLLIGIGAIREILDTGKLLSDAHLVFGERARLWQLNLFDSGCLLFQSTPCVFFIFGLFIAIKNFLKKESKSDSQKTDFIKGAKRVRTTGKIS